MRGVNTLPLFGICGLLGRAACQVRFPEQFRVYDSAIIQSCLHTGSEQGVSAQGSVCHLTHSTVLLMSPYQEEANASLQERRFEGSIFSALWDLNVAVGKI